MPDTINHDTGEINPTVELFGPDGKSIGGPMSSTEFAQRVKDVVVGARPDLADGFALEPPEPGKVPDRVIDELKHARTVAKDHAQAFSDCLKAQAEKYGIKPGALKRYIVALCEDKVEEVENETDDLQRLIGSSD